MFVEQLGKEGECRSIGVFEIGDHHRCKSEGLSALHTRRTSHSHGVGTASSGPKDMCLVVVLLHRRRLIGRRSLGDSLQGSGSDLEYDPLDITHLCEELHKLSDAASLVKGEAAEVL